MTKTFMGASLLAVLASLSLITATPSYAAATCAERAAAVKAEINNAPAAVDPTNANNYYQAAEKAMKANNETECLKALEASSAALRDATNAAKVQEEGRR